MDRMQTRQVKVGSLFIGGQAPITVQSMTNTDTRDAEATIAQIKRLQEAKCDIVRISVYDEDCVKAIPIIKEQIDIPLVADIHFDYRLALQAARSGIDKIRINPGNIGSESKVRELAACAKDLGIPIRVGANSGSLKKEHLEKYGVSAKAMVESALEQAAILERAGFYDIVVSLKASEVAMTVESYRLASRMTDYPMHIGVTEAGFGDIGKIKCAVGLGTLLFEGIGDTLRVSLSGDPVQEVITGREILKSANILKDGIDIISCPTCGRCKSDIESIARNVYEQTRDIRIPLKVAVMGCAVNGPGEARHADVGVACGDGKGVIFCHGEILSTVKEKDIVKTLLDIIQGYH